MNKASYLSPKGAPHYFISMDKLQTNKVEEIHYNLEDPWVLEIFNELQVHVDKEDLLADSPQSLELNLQLQKKTTSILNEHVEVRGNLDLHFQTACVRCLITMPVHLELPIAACFIDPEMEEDPQIKDQLTVYSESTQEELELYVYQQKRLNLQEFLQEQIFLHLDDCPLHEEDCKGICQKCGQNLNEGECQHLK